VQIASREVERAGIEPATSGLQPNRLPNSAWHRPTETPLVSRIGLLTGHPPTPFDEEAMVKDDLADLVTGAEIGRRLGITTQRVHQLASQRVFPRPL
jgi:hypothetical protein